MFRRKCKNKSDVRTVEDMQEVIELQKAVKENKQVANELSEQLAQNGFHILLYRAAGGKTKKGLQ